MLEAVVVGAGLAGFSAALALRERGAAVTVIEAGHAGGGATGASAGMLVAQYESGAPSARFHLCLESRRRYPEFVARLAQLGGEDLRIRWDGMLVANLSREEHSEAEEVARWQRDAGLQAEVVDPAAAAEIQPGVSPEATSYLWLAQEGQLDTQRLGATLGAAVIGADIRLIAGNGVQAVSTAGGTVRGVVTVGGRKLEADVVVLAAGAWSGSIEGLPRDLPVRPVRGQIVRFATADLSLVRIVASHAGRYLVPRGESTAIAGSTMEDVGFNRAITEAGLGEIHRSIAELVPALAARKPIEQWAGLRPISPDSTPIIGPDPDLMGLFYATGYGRDGILLSPLAGEMIADLVMTGSAELDWRPFRVDRFAGAESV